MAVKILRREYTTPFKPASTTTWQLGNVGDWLKLSLLCEFAVEKVFDISDSLTIQDPNILTLNDGSSWNDWGFDVGMNCTLFFNFEDVTVNPSIAYPNTTTFTIGNITGSSLEALDAFGNPKTQWGYQYGQIAPIRFNDYEINSVVVYSEQLPQGIKLNYTNLSNNDVVSGGLNSHIDGTKTSFVAEDTDLINTGEKYQIFTPNDFDFYLTPYQSGLSVERVTAEYRGSQSYRHNYLIEVYYMLSPFGDLTNFINNTPPDVVAGAEAITDNFEVIGYPVYNNPNVEITNDPRDTAIEGNTGWFDENYNQLPNNFNHTPVVYRNLTGQVVNALDYANPITITTTLSGIPNLSGLTRFQYGFIWIPQDEDQYKETDFPFHENTKVSTGGDAANLNDVFPLSPVVNSPFPLLRNGYSSDGAAMDASDISFVQNGTAVDVTITFRPNAAFTTFFNSLGDQERQYALWVSAGDQQPETNKSDRVSLLLDFNTMQTFVTPVGPYPGMTINFLDHTQDENDTPVPCGNDIFVEDDLLAKVEFQVDTSISATNPIPTAITYGFLVENTTTGQQYVLDQSPVDLTQFPDVTQYNFSTSRGFKLGTGNSKNLFEVLYNGNAGGTIENVLGFYGYKVRWEDWIERFPAPPTDFYDNTQARNGLNNDWFHYFNTAGWRFYFYVDVAATLNGQSVVYQTLKELIIADYDSNSIITTELKYYRNIVGNPDTKGTQLIGGIDPVTGGDLGVIPKGEIVWLDIEYTRSSGSWVDQAFVDANVYGINCSEVDQGAGQFEFRQLSSIWGPEFDNPMIPIPSETLCKVTFVSTTVIRVECRIDSNKLIDADRYKISGRIGCIV